MPRNGWILPLRGDVAQSQPDQFCGGFIVGEVTLVTNALAHLRMKAFDRVGRVDYLAYFGSEDEERDDVFPVPAPALRDGRE